MLRRFFVGSLAALILLFFVCFGNSFHLEKITLELEEQAWECFREAGQGEETKARAEKLVSLWKQKQGYLEMTLPHAEVEAAAMTIMEFAGALEAQDENESVRAYALLCEKLAHLGNVDSFSIRNIL